ncbi:hypothetical protein [Amycolatopsis pigmentata]|uniref:N-acetyltransferase domain-containing protein n=1 Tax=Amycolatopsis pigmentata TaxID=450801 RepID=A0ABW5FMK7_9PSEU
MSETSIDAVVAVLRRDGSVAVPAGDLGDVDAWRRQVRRACRAAGLRIRTGVSDNGVVWVDHVDHVVTDAEQRATNRAVSNLLKGQPPVPFRQLVREEQRKVLTAVESAPAAPATQPSNTAAALPGEVDSIVIDYSSRQHAFKTDEEQRLHQWYAKVECLDDVGDPAYQVGYVLAYTVGFDHMTDPFMILDAETADLAHIGGIVFDLETGELDQELGERVEPFGDGLLIIDSVRLEPEWRGHGLGPLVVGMVIERLGEGRQLAALQAAPTERRNDAGEVVDKISEADRATAAGKLGALWSQLGFEFFKDEVWVLNLGMRTFGDRLAAIRRSFGLG